MQDLIIGMAVNVLIQLVRNNKEKTKWRAALLKVFREIAKAFSFDEEFATVAKAHLPIKMQ